MRSAGIALAALALVWPATSQACSPVRYTPDLVSYLRTDFARLMWEQAITVDLAVAERARPLDVPSMMAESLAAALREEPDKRRQREIKASYGKLSFDLRRDGAALITFRSIERLKGDGPATFQLAGFWNQRLAIDVPRGSEFPTLEDVYYTLGGPSELSSQTIPRICGFYIAAGHGQTFLIFRKADGHLLNSGIPFRWTASGEPGFSAGFPYLRVTGPTDPWLLQVRDVAGLKRMTP